MLAKIAGEIVMNLAERLKKLAALLNAVLILQIRIVFGQVQKVDLENVFLMFLLD